MKIYLCKVGDINVKIRCVRILVIFSGRFSFYNIDLLLFIGIFRVVVLK